MHKPKKSIAVVLFVLVTLVALYGIRAIRIARESSFASCEKVNGLCAETIHEDGEVYLLAPDELHDTGLTSEDLPSLDNPDFVSIAEVDDVLADSILGLDVEVGGEHRFYSFQILNWHHVVNDTFNGTRLTVTHCPLCQSGIVYESVVDGTTVSFDTDGREYDNNFLLRDRETGSLWSQIRGLAISGNMIGTELTVYPSQTMSWATWKESYPNSQVLSTETGYTRDYTAHPYGEYEKADILYFPMSDDLDTRISAKWKVYGLTNGIEHLAFSGTILAGFGAANEMLGDRSVVGLYDYDLNLIRAFDRTVDGETLTFTYDFDTEVLTDEETGTVWNAEGRATSGKLAGTQLEQINGKEAFWMCWSQLYPDTKLSKIDGQGDLE